MMDSPAGRWLENEGIKNTDILAEFSFREDRQGGWHNVELMHFICRKPPYTSLLGLYSINTMHPRSMDLIRDYFSEEKAIEDISKRYFIMLSSGRFLMTYLRIYGEEVNDDIDDYHLMFDGSGIDSLSNRALKEIENTLGDERGKLAQLIKTPLERAEDVIQGLEGWKKKSQDRQLEWERYQRGRRLEQEKNEDKRNMSRYLDEITSEDFWKEKKEDEDEITNS